MAKARAIEAVGPAATFREAAAAAVRERALEVFEHERRALDLSDPEAVHDMRVATRRLRAALEIYAAAFPRKAHAALLEEVKNLADDLGARRDPDVAIDALERTRDELAEADRPGIDSLLADLRTRRDEGNERLATGLARVRESGLPRRLEALSRLALDDEPAP
jgi:CHAD domain-containing protein